MNWALEAQRIQLAHEMAAQTAQTSAAPATPAQPAIVEQLSSAITPGMAPHQMYNAILQVLATLQPLLPIRGRTLK